MCLATVTSVYDTDCLRIRWGSPQDISDDEAKRIVTELLSSVYDAFRLRGEDEVYDALAVSTSGDLLEDLYLQIQQSLRMAEQGGALARVQEVDITNIDRKSVISNGNPRPTDYAFLCHCRWNISGTVEHWGHIHERTNQFQASFLTEPVLAQQNDVTSSKHHWKFTSIDITDGKRVHFETRLRNLISSP
jgi:hypothetical protein